MQRQNDQQEMVWHLHHLACLVLQYCVTSFGLGVSLAFFFESLWYLPSPSKSSPNFFGSVFSTDLAAAAVREDNKESTHQRWFSESRTATISQIGTVVDYTWTALLTSFRRCHIPELDPAGGMVSSSWHDTKNLFQQEVVVFSCTVMVIGSGLYILPPIQKFKRVSLDRNGCNTKQRENSLAFSSSLMPFVPILQSVQQSLSGFSNSCHKVLLFRFSPPHNSFVLASLLVSFPTLRFFFRIMFLWCL
jgi:hypothetical protein